MPLSHWKYSQFTSYFVMMSDTIGNLNVRILHSTTSRDLNLKIQGKEGNLQVATRIRISRERNLIQVPETQHFQIEKSTWHKSSHNPSYLFACTAVPLEYFQYVYSHTTHSAATAATSNSQSET